MEGHGPLSRVILSGVEGSLVHVGVELGHGLRVPITRSVHLYEESFDYVQGDTKSS
jgi:hypothetical protein